MISLDKEILLLNKLIYNTTLDMNGLISTIEIMQTCSEKPYIYYYRVFYDVTRDHGMLFVNDIKNGSIKFLIPNGPTIFNNIYEESTIKDLKEYFGDEYSDDLILRMPEEERQRQIKKMADLINSLDFWNNYKDSIDKK